MQTATLFGPNKYKYCRFQRFVVETPERGQRKLRNRLT